MADRDRRINLFLLADEALNMNVVGQAVGELLHPLPNEVENEDRVRRPRNKNFYEITVQSYPDDLFKEHFRMSRGVFQELVNILGHNVEHGNDTIDFRKKVMFTVWTLSKPESFLAAGDRFDLAKSTAHGIFKAIISAIAELLPNYISFPTAAQFQTISNNFQARSRGFPGVIGAIDGCHIPIKQPEGNAHDFYNRKGFHSIILQGTCDHKGKFIDCFIGMPGRMHDARVFRNSPLYQRLTDVANPLLPQNYHLIGDSAYPVMVNLMCPFRDNGHLNENQIRFNVKLSSIRSIIERAFGVLKNKFRRLKYIDISNPEFGNTIIAAGCVLHNFLIEQNEILMHEEIENPPENIIHVDAEEEPTVEAVDKRNSIALTLM